MSDREMEWAADSLANDLVGDDTRMYWVRKGASGPDISDMIFRSSSRRSNVKVLARDWG